jgi:hypothetical protein
MVSLYSAGVVVHPVHGAADKRILAPGDLLLGLYGHSSSGLFFVCSIALGRLPSVG